MEFNTLKVCGAEVAQHISDWISKGHYKRTPTIPKFTENTACASRWQSTLPCHIYGNELHWNKISHFVINLTALFKPIKLPVFSMDKVSGLYKELKEVYDISNKIAKTGNASKEVAIALCGHYDPYVSVVWNQLIFINKKTPDAYWICITKIVNTYFYNMVYAHTKN